MTPEEWSREETKRALLEALEDETFVQEIKASLLREPT